MKYSISLAHEGSGIADITIRRGGTVDRNRPTMTPFTIEIEAPGLEVDYQQLLALHKLIKGYKEYTLSEGAGRVLSGPLMALKVLEQSFQESGWLASLLDKSAQRFS
jgi:hypothetical protein